MANTSGKETLDGPSDKINSGQDDAIDNVHLQQQQRRLEDHLKSAQEYAAMLQLTKTELRTAICQGNQEIQQLIEKYHKAGDIDVNTQQLIDMAILHAKDTVELISATHQDQIEALATALTQLNSTTRLGEDF